MSQSTRSPALSAALEEGVAALFQNPLRAPFRKRVPEEGIELEMDFQSGALSPLMFECTVRHEDGRKETFLYS